MDLKLSDSQSLVVMGVTAKLGKASGGGSVAVIDLNAALDI